MGGELRGVLQLLLLLLLFARGLCCVSISRFYSTGNLAGRGRIFADNLLFGQLLLLLLLLTFRSHDLHIGLAHYPYVRPLRSCPRRFTRQRMIVVRFVVAGFCLHPQFGLLGQRLRLLSGCYIVIVASNRRACGSLLVLLLLLRVLQMAATVAVGVVSRRKRIAAGRRTVPVLLELRCSTERPCR